MDNDSDSDGSHVSATPPRDNNPQPSALSTLLASYKSRVRVQKALPRSALISKSKSKTKSSTQKIVLPQKLDPKPSPQDRSSNHIPLTDVPFQIRRLNYQNHVKSNVDSIENLPAGYFSKFASFSKIQKTSLNLESIEINSHLDSLVPASQSEKVFPSSQSFSKIQKTCLNLQSVEINPPLGPSLSAPLSEKIPPDVECVAVNSGSSRVKILKKLSNLIGCSVDTVPAKRLKCQSEGNFVRLNINGYGNKRRKFMNKGGSRNQYSSNGRRKFRKYKKNTKAKGDGDEADGSYDEHDLVSEMLHHSNGQGGLKFNLELMEEAVMACRHDASEENLVKLLKLVYGYDSFRDGQLEAIKLVLSRKSTMLVLPTGAGKSLCYQLPSIILPGITLVVSPLVSLMIDQLKHLPPMIQGGLLSSTQTGEEASETLRMLHEGAIKVLFISPERFTNLEFLSIVSASAAISLVVVDEAHCVSEWSHNFRPSYMRLRASLLHDRLNAECILAMTATATSKTLHSVMSALEIPPTNLIQTSQLRENLQLSVSLSSNRMKDLLMLIKSSPYKESQSIIIYCKFQYETDLISKYLRDSNISAKSYHSAIPAKDRRRTQELFCINKLRVVVATVAFGMGLDKKDVGSVIHYSLPESLEEYVQEIGRAGRDGRLSYCHLLFDDITYFKLRSLMYSDGVDEYAVKKFFCHVFSNDVGSLHKITSIVKEPASRKFDMKEEVMLTILTQLELGEVQYVQLLPQINVTCTMNFHETSPALLANKDIVVAAILNKSEVKHGQYVFDIPTVANSIGLTAIDISNQLQNLKIKGEIRYEVKDPAYCYKVIRAPEDICLLATQFTKWLSDVESCKVRKFDAMYNAAMVAVEAGKMQNGQVAQHTACLQKILSDYFSEDEISDGPNKMSQSSRFLPADIKVFLQNNSQVKLTPRAVARIMHGIPSPAYPSAVWSKTHFWGRYCQIDFLSLIEAAKEELMNFVGKNLD